MLGQPAVCQTAVRDAGAGDTGDRSNRRGDAARAPRAAGLDVPIRSASVRQIIAMAATRIGPGHDEALRRLSRDSARSALPVALRDGTARIVLILSDTCECFRRTTGLVASSVTDIYAS